MSKKKYIKHTCKVVTSGAITEVYVYEKPQFKKIEHEEKKTVKKTKKKENKINTEEEYTRQERTINRTKRMLRRLINANLGQYNETDKFITLTFEQKPTRDEVFEKFKQFNRRLNKQYKKYNYQYIAVIEKGTQNTKRYHLHCLFFGLPYIAQADLQDIWQYGIVDVRKVSDFYDITRYLIKYISKTLSDSTYIPKGKKAYTTSHGLIKPIEDYLNDEEVLERLKNKSAKVVYKNRYNNVYQGSYNYFKLKTKERE